MKNKEPQLIAMTEAMDEPKEVVVEYDSKTNIKPLDEVLSKMKEGTRRG